MKITDSLTKSAILPNLAATDKKSVLYELTAPLAKQMDYDQELLVKVLMERERLGSTGLQGGIAIPHGKLPDIANLVLGFGLSANGVEFESMDGRPAHIFFVLITPTASTDLHLQMLARLSRMLKNETFKSRLKSAKDRDQILEILRSEDNNANLM